MPRRVAIVSTGAITCHGVGVRATWERVLNAQTGIAPVTRFDTQGLCSNVAAEAPDDATMQAILRQRFGVGVPIPEDRASRLLLAAAAECEWVAPPTRRGVVVATAKGAFEQRSPGRDVLGIPAQTLAKATKSEGPVLTVSAACASGIAAIREGTLLLETRACDEVLVGGTEALHAFVYSGFHALKALSPSPARPFDAARDGLSLGEGAAVMVLTLAHPGEEALGYIHGHAVGSDGHDQTAPDPTGAGFRNVLLRALRMGGVTPEQVSRYQAHGTATRQNDAMEAVALKSVFPFGVSVGAVKGSVGHTLGAAGVLEAVLAVEAMGARRSVPVVGLQQPDPSLGLTLSAFSRPDESPWTLIGSAGFGGINAALLLERGELFE